MADATDWRPQGQEKYLKGAAVRWPVYRRSQDNPDWDHDHCEFCWAKFMREDHPDVLHEGYSTVDEYRWICKGCFEDFKGHLPVACRQVSVSRTRLLTSVSDKATV